VLPLAAVDNNGLPLRINPGQEPTSVAVPGQTLGQALTLLPNIPPVGDVLPPIQFMTNLILGSPAPPNGASKSQVDTAIALQPETVIIWLGNNDVLGVFEGIQKNITDPEAFASAYLALLNRLRLSNPNSKVIVANIPDVTLIPMMAPFLQEDPALQPQLRGLVLAYNTAIATAAAAFGIPVVDIYSVFNDLAKNGLKVGPQHLTTGSMGGLFSTDGVHPTNTGYAVIANQFISTIKDVFHINIRPINLVQIARNDPLTPGNFTGTFQYCAGVR
jgi:lysophospholipase L1-like esterase